MFKKITCCILILSFFGAQISKLSIYVNFKINQDYIAEVLCINKDKPMLECNGKCHLSNQLKSQDKREEKNAPKERNERVEVLYFENAPIDFYVSNDLFFEREVCFPQGITLNIQDLMDDIEHPPQLG